MDDLMEPTGECEMCGREEIRYVHHMEHPHYEEVLGVGCVCAEKMENEYHNLQSNARKRETKLRRLSARRKTWPHLKSWKISGKGNPYIIKDGYHVVIFKKYGEYNFKITSEISGKESFSTGTFKTILEAKIEAFDAIFPPHYSKKRPRRCMKVA